MFFSAFNKNTVSDSISLSTLLRGCIVAFSILTCVLFYLQYFLDFQFYADVWTYVLLIAFCMFLYHFSVAGKKQYENSMRLGVALLVLLSFVPSMLMLTVFPLAFIGSPYSIQEFNKAILTFGLLLFVFYSGIKAAAHLPSSGDKPETSSFLPDITKAKTALYIIAYSSLLITLYLGQAMGWTMGTKWESGWIVRLFPTSLYSYMLALLWMWHGKALPKKDRVIIAGFFSVIVLSGISQGSRSGIYTVLIIFLITGIILRGNLNVSKRLLKFMFASGLILGPVIWMLGTSIRSTGRWSFSLRPDDMASAFMPIVMRLGAATINFIKAINDWGDRQVIDSMLTLGNLIKVGINGFVPGDLFDAPFSSSGNLWETIMYGEQIGLRVMGEGWSGFGFYYILCGFWVIPVVFLYALISTLILRFLTHRKTLFSSLIAINFFLIFVFDFFNKGMLDSAITDTLLYGSYILIFYFILVVVVGATKNEKPA